MKKNCESLQYELDRGNVIYGMFLIHVIFLSQSNLEIPF